MFLPIFHPPIFQLHDEIIGDLERGRTIPKLPGYIFRDAFVLNRRVKLNFTKDRYRRKILLPRDIVRGKDRSSTR